MLTIAYHWLADNRNALLRPAAVLLILGVSVALPWWGDQRLTVALVGLLAVGAMALVVLQNPIVGLLAGVVGGFFVPYTGPSGLNVTMLGAALVLGIWALEIITRQWRLPATGSVAVRPALLLVLVTGISFVFGQLPWFTWPDSAPLGAQAGGYALVVLSVAVFLFVAFRLETLAQLKIITWTFLAVASLIVLDWAVPLPNLTSRIIQPASIGSMFWTWFAALALAQVLFNRKLHPVVRLLLTLALLAGVYEMFVNQRDWKSGWLPFLVSIGAVLAVRSWRLALLFGLLSAAPAVFLVQEALADDAYSVSTRLDAWLILARIARESPVLGLGFANYSWYTPLFPIRGYAVQFNSHNQYVDLVAQAGLVGLLAYLGFFLALLLEGWRTRRLAPPGFAYAYVLGAMGGLLGTLVAGMLGDWVIPYFYNLGLSGFRASIFAWIFLGGLVLVGRLLRGHELARSNPAALQSHSYPRVVPQPRTEIAES